MELVGGNGATQDAGDGQAKHEIARFTQATWRKSSWSAVNGNCVEVAGLPGGLIAVRDSKDATCGPVLAFEAASWRSFIDRVKGPTEPE